MKFNSYLYNNEALASIALGYFLKKQGIISIAKVLLVLPFVLHEPTVKKLKCQSFKRSLEEFILKHPECLLNFNGRFLDFLPLAINALTLLNAMKVIRIKRDMICFNYDSSFFHEYPKNIGARANNMFPAIDVLYELMQDQNINSFYLKLKIEL